MAMKIKGKAPERLALLRVSQSDEINFKVQASENKPVQVYLYDVIGWPFIEAQDLLYQIPSGAKQIDVHIHSPGGDVFEGMAIYNLLRDHKATVNITVDSLAASSASLIAMSGDTISMSAASFLMIHNPYSFIMGDAGELRQEADLLDKISNVFADAYSSHTGKSRQAMLDMMKDETWFTPEEAISEGLASSITENGSGKTAKYNLTLFENTPKALKDSSKSTASRQASANNKNKEKGNEMEMDKNVRAILERLGLSKDATDKQAWEYLANVDLDKIEAKEEKKQVEQEFDKITTPTPATPSAIDPAEAAREAAKAERKRAADIRALVKDKGLSSTVAEHFIDKDVSVAEAKESVEVFAKMQDPVGAGRIQINADERDKFRQAAIDGLGFRVGVRTEKPAVGFEDFRKASIESIARMCLERSGVNTSGMNSRDQIAREVLKRSASGGFSTDDFSSIFMDVANKAMLKAYQEAPNTWRPFVNIVPVSDFKQIYGVSLSEAPDLELVNEHGEYKSGEMKDKNENYSIGTYGKIIYLTRVMIVNDDMRAFARLPQLLGSAARRKESDLVWAKITGNPTMNEDSTALFHADHDNLESTDVGLMTADRLSNGRTAMRKQTGMTGAYLDINPAFLLLPLEQETDGEVVLRSTALPETNYSSGVNNPWAGKLMPIAEPRLSADSTTAWYLVGDPAQVDTIEVAYLDGVEEPYTEESQEFTRDALGYKIRHDFGCGIMDYRGFYKNPGA